VRVGAGDTSATTEDLGSTSTTVESKADRFAALALLRQQGQQRLASNPPHISPPPPGPPEPMPQGIINGASAPFPYAYVHIINQWQVSYNGEDVRVYFGSLAADTSQGVAIVLKRAIDSGLPVAPSGSRLLTPKKDGAIRAVSATATTVTGTTPNGATYTYDVTTGKLIAN
jgi:hypothetical protein